MNVTSVVGVVAVVAVVAVVGSMAVGAFVAFVMHIIAIRQQLYFDDERLAMALLLMVRQEELSAAGRLGACHRVLVLKLTSVRRTLALPSMVAQGIMLSDARGG